MATGQNDTIGYDDTTPDKLTNEHLEEDLSLANEVGGWFNYYLDEDNRLVADQYGDNGAIIATWLIETKISKIS